MTTPRTSRLILGSLAAVALAVTACAPTGVASPNPPKTSVAPSEAAPPTAKPTPSQEPSSSPSTAPKPSEAPSTTPSATPTAPQSPSASPTAQYTGDPAQLIPGKNHIGSAASYVYPAKLVQQWLEGEVKPTEKIVFLTFDDGPNHTTTPTVLKALKDGGAHATFFVVGSVLGDAPELLKRELAEGNSVALHSWSHNYKSLYPGRKANADRVAQEYQKTLARIREIVGPDFNTEAWRYPGGHMSWKNMAASDAYLAKQGVAWIDWNVDTADSAPKKTRPKTVDALVHNATAPIRQGFHVAVVLAHDTPDKKLTAQSVPAIIRAYKEAGYKFGVIS